ncbi:choloylglycine hydrolase [Lacticaseibacillus thailandensis DSM 22698 = JCM 13996]|uniref:Choloylglycine hydrolase n=2 Tax=Lacticaseibacillus thailandensis TaxID=381741 RepID=A0A0R2CHZ7_9LACO|nr:choloylglycine hydrolase [Lacticaseibacillus thailandensis DSM 22698 = JCM 13996]
MTYPTSDGQYWLARTMDFGFELGGNPVVVPRDYPFHSVTGATFTTRLGFVGAGAKMNDYILVDGVNEAGLSAATLYFSDEAHYADTPSDDRLNLASFELVNWILGTNRTTAEVQAHLDQVQIVNFALPQMDGNIPLHWIIADRDGHCKVLEIQADGVHWYDDQVGVMTNSPDFAWHRQNLGNYVQLSNGSAPDRQFSDYTAREIGPGSGALGLPGDYTSTSRFVRAAFMRANAPRVPDADAANTVNHLLEPFDIPRNIKGQANGEFDYTQYRGYMQMSNGTYYFQPYQNSNLSAVRLTEALLNKDAVTTFPVARKQDVTVLN